MKFAPIAAVASALLGAASAQPRRLRIVNGCESQPLWVAHISGAAGTAGPDPQDTKIEPLQHRDFQTSDNLKAMRYWPKMGCDTQGGNCAIGDSGGPEEACVIRNPGVGDDYSRCAPPVDSKFEASFGVNGKPCNPQTPGGTEMLGCDYLDISLVDGYTLPLKLEIDGDCRDSLSDALVDEIDCSELSLDACPTQEVLTSAGMTVDLQAVNPRTHNVSGCYSPCNRLLDTKWIHEAERRPEGPAALYYCCPTPPDGSGISPEACRAGPIEDTQYVGLVRNKCKGAYSYAYDDGNGLLRCSSASQYTLTFYCPTAPAAVQPAARVAANSTRAQAFLFP